MRRTRRPSPRSVQQPADFGVTGVIGFPQNQKAITNYHYSLDMQYQLPFDSVMFLGYQGNSDPAPADPGKLQRRGSGCRLPVQPADQPPGILEEQRQCQLQRDDCIAQPQLLAQLPVGRAIHLVESDGRELGSVLRGSVPVRHPCGLRSRGLTTLPTRSRFGDCGNR